MNGIIYKFTIRTTKTFYVGQTTCSDFSYYWGSGTIWNAFLKGLKSQYPTCWKRLVKREILWQGECNQKTLDKLEEVYIRREHALHSENLGGCNILKGTSNEFGSGSPMKDPTVVERQRKTLKKTYQEHPEIIKRIHQKRQWLLDHTDYKQRISQTLMGRYSGEKNPNYGNYWTPEQKANLSAKMKGRFVGEKNANWRHRWNEEKRKQLSEKLRNKAASEGYVNPMTGKVRITNGEINTVIPKDAPLPEGFWYGMKPRKS